MVLEQLQGIVGAGNISLQDGEPDSDERVPSAGIRSRCIVHPRDASQVREIVLLARKTGTPLVPVSSSKPHFHGGGVPATGGAVVVDLSGLKNIIHIDRKNRVAMFEAGVTFGELIPALAKEGLRPNIPLLPRQGKSVAGSLLDREPVVMPKYHWDIADPLACMEIIFGTGDMFRTGAAAGSGSIEEQWEAGGAQKEAAGPSSSSWYRIIQGSQGTMGIVTWVSARCELIPRIEEPYFIMSDRLGDLLEMTHWLLRLRLVNECFILNAANFATIVTTNGTDANRLKDNLPRWVLFYNVGAYDYFPEERIRGQVEDIRGIATRNSLVPVSPMAGVDARSFLRLVQKTSEELYWKLRPKGAFQDIFCVAQFDDVDRLAAAMEETAAAHGCSGQDIGVYLQPVVQGVNWHCEFTIFHNNRNESETRRVNRAAGAAIEALTFHGGFFSRPYGECAGEIVNRDAASLEVMRKLKKIADPDNIMNPGKLGL